MLTFSPDADGSLVLPLLPVPASPVFDGVRFATQAAIASPGAPLFDLAISNAVLLTLGQ